MIMEGLDTYVCMKHLKRLQSGLKQHFGKFFGRWESQFGPNVGMNGQGEEVVLPSCALKYLVGVGESN